MPDEERLVCFCIIGVSQVDVRAEQIVGLALSPPVVAGSMELSMVSIQKAREMINLPLDKPGCGVRRALAFGLGLPPVELPSQVFIIGNVAIVIHAPHGQNDCFQIMRENPKIRRGWVGVVKYALEG